MITIHKGLAILLISFIPIMILAQESSYIPKQYIDADGTIFWNKSLPIYIRISPDKEGKGTLLQSQNPEYSNPIFLDTEGTNYIRTRYAVHKETKKTITPLKEVMMPIVADGTSPKSTISFNNAEKYRSKGIQYYGPGLSIEVSSEDALSGLELLKYDLNSSGYKDYQDEIDINNQGNHTISYYAVDKVGNKESTKKKDFIVDLTPPMVTHNINGFADENVISSASKIYFTATDELSGVKHVYYRFDDGEYKLFDGSSVRFSNLNDGDHVLEYYAEDHVKNRSGIYRYELYYDKTAPLTASDILGDRFVVNDKIYFSGRTKMKITAVDNKVGVKEILYSIDGGDFIVYDQPFYLPSIPGQHQIRFYSTDRLSNRPSGSESYKHNISLVYLDLTGPSISHKISGPSFEAGGVQYISPRTKIEVVGRDKESGLQYLTYSIDGVSSEKTYSEPFTISTSGPHNIELFGYDNVNNRNIGSTSVFVDADPPSIYQTYSTASIGYDGTVPLYPSYVTVYLAATDEIVGSDKIYYSINEGSEKLYTNPIGQLRKNAEYKIFIRALDKVGNESTRLIIFKTSEN